jgi:phosphoserine aminotransferase
MRTYNFNPGPAVLPASVIATAQAALVDYRGTGIGIIEMSHRSDEFLDIHHRAIQDLRTLLEVPSNYHVLFCQGGATLQFSMVPMNLIDHGAGAAYLDTGVWSTKGYEEACKFGKAYIVASSKDQGYRTIPTSYTVPEDASYLHFTSNNTIIGSQYHSEPFCPASVPLIADTSSDLLHRPLPISSYGLLYASAQKNLGPAGVTVVIIRDDLLETIPNGLPILCDYRSYSKYDSLLNTPPTFAIYVLSLMLDWVKDNGGLPALYKRNRSKAQLLYNTIDSLPIYQPFVSTECRSLMNATFTLETKELEEKFLKTALQEGFVGLPGHRLLKGVRVSMYNALEVEAIEALVAFMKHFAASC